jgi:hypothetical protein
MNNFICYVYEISLEHRLFELDELKRRSFELHLKRFEELDREEQQLLDRATSLDEVDKIVRNFKVLTQRLVMLRNQLNEAVDRLDYETAYRLAGQLVPSFQRL